MYFAGILRKKSAILREIRGKFRWIIFAKILSVAIFARVSIVEHVRFCDTHFTCKMLK